MIKNISAAKIGTIALALIVVTSGILMLKVSSQESAIMDELAHIPSGYSYDRYFDYRLNPEHPPILKSLAAVPLLFMGLNFPLNYQSWAKDVNGQWDTGDAFLYGVNDRRADSIIFWARIFPILLTLLLVVLVYLWSKKLLGPIWALLPALFIGLSPNFLAHGHYVTTDLAAALGFFIAIWAYIRYLTSPNRKRFWIAGIIFGVAQLLKFSTVLLIPLFVFFMVMRWWLKARESGWKLFSGNSLKSLWKYFVALVGIFIVGYVLVWGVYAIFTANYPIERQSADTTYILSSFGGGPDPNWQKCPPKGIGMRCLADIDIWMSSSPVFRSIGHYLLGVLMVIQRSAGGNTAYFLGQISNGGWWYYFPVIFIAKEPIPILIAIGLGLLLAFQRFLKNTGEHKKNRFFNYLELNFAEFAMISTVLFYWLYSMRSTLNIGFRHVLPTLPFLYILAAGSIKKWYDKKPEYEYIAWTKKISTAFKTLLKKSLKIFLIAGLAAWLLVDVLVSYPYFLSFFNYFGGGIWHGYKTVVDSNYDWGQDFRRLKTFVEENKIDKIAVDYFGGGNIGYYLGDKAIPWQSSKGNPVSQGINWYAVSINSIESVKAKPVNNYEVKQEDTYQWIQNYENPYARVGTSIFIYRLQ
jgi:hypothetical protein